MNGARGRLQGLMNVKRLVESYLKWVIITSGHKNKNWGEEKNNECMKAKCLISRIFFFLSYLYQILVLTINDRSGSNSKPFHFF